MNLDQLLEAADQLSPEDRDKLKAHLAERQETAKLHTVEEWTAELEDIAREFRGDSSDDEMREIIEAMNIKSKLSDKGL